MPILWRFEQCIQREACISRNRKIGVESHSHDSLLGIAPAHARPNLGQDLLHEQNAVDQDAVGGPLDLEIAEECVCAEEEEHFIQRVVRFVRAVDGKVCDVWRELRKLDCGTAGAGAKGEEGKVAD